MNISKKSFFGGFFLGIILGPLMVMIIGLVIGLMILNDPSGPLARLTLGKAREYASLLGPLISLKQMATSAVTKLKTPELRIKFPYAFQKIPFTGSRIEKSGSLISWIALFSDRVPIDLPPPKEKIKKSGQTRPFEISGFKGETLSFQVVLRTKHDLDNIRVSLNPDPADEISCIQIHRFKEIYLKVMIKQDGFLKKVISPDPLVPFTDPYSPNHKLIETLSLHGKENQPIWIDVHFSENCKNKKFSGRLQITRNGSILRNSPIIFHVLNATLPQDVNLDRWMQLYLARFVSGENLSNDDLFKKEFARYFSMAHQYGFSTGDCGEISPNIHWNSDGSISSVDWSRFDSLVGPEISGEITGKSPNVWCLPMQTYWLGTVGGFTYMSGTPSDIKDWKGLPEHITKEIAKNVVQHWKEKGWPLKRGFAYVWDEPDHQLYYPFIYQLIANISEDLHKASNGQIRVMLTDAPFIWNKHEYGHHKSVMYKKIDIWAPGVGIYIPEKLKPYQESGKRTWFYGGSPPFLAQGDITGKGPGFRMWFWTAWKYQVNGVFYWASDMWSGNSVTENPYTKGGTEDGVIFYPGHQLHFIGISDIDGPIPSIRMAQWRRGYEDYKYLTMLKNKGEEEFANKIVNNMVKKALDDGGYIPYWRNPLWGRAGDWNHDPRMWHKARKALANEIVKLYSTN